MLPNDVKASLEPVRDRAGVERLAEELSKHPVIGFDTEFIRERTFFPVIALIQVATRERSWLVDPTVLNGEEMGPLLKVLTDPNILKVVHAAYADQECLFWSYQCLAHPIVDTAVAAALSGKGDSVGLGNLLRSELKVNLPKGLARAKWLERPLPRQLAEYAVLDVAYLVELWESLAAGLRPLGREQWALEESQYEAAHFDESPEEIARRIAKSGSMDAKTRGVLSELVQWRESRAKKGNLPRNWVADNETLKSIAKVKPKTLDELASFRGINRREITQEGNRILDAIRKGMAGEGKSWEPQGPRRPIPTEDDERAADLLKAYVNWLASKHNIAPRLLLTGDKFLQLIYAAGDGPKAWVEKGILSPRGADLIGASLEEFLQGKRGLAIRDRQVRVFPLAPEN